MGGVTDGRQRTGNQMVMKKGPVDRPFQRPSPRRLRCRPVLNNARLGGIDLDMRDARHGIRRWVKGLGDGHTQHLRIGLAYGGYLQVRASPGYLRPHLALETHYNPTVMIITAIPTTMPSTAMTTIGLENLVESEPSPRTMRRAMKCAKPMWNRAKIACTLLLVPALWTVCAAQSAVLLHTVGPK